MKKLLFIILNCLLLISFAGCGNNKPTSKNDTTDSVETTEEITIKEKPIAEKLQEATTIEEVKQLLNGTTWHYTENIDNSEIGCWLKVDFNGNNYTTYYALPSEGEWTKVKNQTEYDTSKVSQPNKTMLEKRRARILASINKLDQEIFALY